MDESETDTWYVLADGTHAHPDEVERGEDGLLKSKGGVPVALRDNGLPLTSGVATKSNRQAARAARKSPKQSDAGASSDARTEPTAADDEAAAARTAEAQQAGGGYNTRESKAD